MEATIRLLEELTRLPGIPGREGAVANWLMECPIADAGKRRIDANGNVWVQGKGPKTPPIVILAHIDEVGFLVKKVEDDGRLSVVGHERLDLRTMSSEVMQVWTAKGPIPAFVTVGQQTSCPKDYANMTPENFRLELGVNTRGEAEALGVAACDVVTFDPSFHRLPGGLVCAKAIDDRSGVAALIKAFELSAGKRRHLPVMLGTAQEEIGGQGAMGVEFAPKPAALVNVDICGGEVYSLAEPDRRTILGKGPILHDGPESSHGMVRRFMELAKAEGIPFQHLAAAGRGADLSILQQKSGGLPAINLILPMSYYHGPRGLINPADVLHCARLIAAALADKDFVKKATKF
jgi:putative aminopeptidase FrvX